jgi:hypothetical protein
MQTKPIGFVDSLPANYTDVANRIGRESSRMDGTGRSVHTLFWMTTEYIE